VDVLVESVAAADAGPEGESEEEAETIGRAEHQAPEVDGECRLAGSGTQPFAIGDVVRCRVIAAQGVDLIVEPVELIAPAGGVP